MSITKNHCSFAPSLSLLSSFSLSLSFSPALTRTFSFARSRNNARATVARVGTLSLLPILRILFLLSSRASFSLFRSDPQLFQNRLAPARGRIDDFLRRSAIAAALPLPFAPEGENLPDARATSGNKVFSIGSRGTRIAWISSRVQTNEEKRVFLGDWRRLYSFFIGPRLLRSDGKIIGINNLIFILQKLGNSSFLIIVWATVPSRTCLFTVIFAARTIIINQTLDVGPSRTIPCWRFKLL